MLVVSLLCERRKVVAIMRGADHDDITHPYEQHIFNTPGYDGTWRVWAAKRQARGHWNVCASMRGTH